MPDSCLPGDDSFVLALEKLKPCQSASSYMLEHPMGHTARYCPIHGDLPVKTVKDSHPPQGKGAQPR